MPAQDGTSFDVTGSELKFTPDPAALPNAGTLDLLKEAAGPNILFQSRSASFSKEKFSTLSEIRSLELVPQDDRATELVPQVMRLHLRKAKPAVVYKARPLNGIWATAPYLHNGSVPNLTELLKPVKGPDEASSRKKSFFTGNTQYDPVNVGFVSDSGPSAFDATVPGNLNIGHEYGTNLSADEKLCLIEYLKSL